MWCGPMRDVIDEGKGKGKRERRELQAERELSTSRRGSEAQLGGLAGTRERFDPNPFPGGDSAEPSLIGGSSMQGH